MPMGFDLANAMMAIHAEEARCELRRQRLRREEEVDPRWRPVRPGARLPCRLGRLLVALGRRLEGYGRSVEPLREQRAGGVR